MIKLNETSANLNVVSEDALSQVVGGSCHRRRGGYRHCGGYRPRRHCGGYDRYESYDSYEGSDGYEGSDESESPSDSSSNNVQVADVNVTVNIAQVQG